MKTLKSLTELSCLKKGKLYRFHEIHWSLYLTQQDKQKKQKLIVNNSILMFLGKVNKTTYRFLFGKDTFYLNGQEAYTFYFEEL